MFLHFLYYVLFYSYVVMFAKGKHDHCAINFCTSVTLVLLQYHLLLSAEQEGKWKVVVAKASTALWLLQLYFPSHCGWLHCQQARTPASREILVGLPGPFMILVALQGSMSCRNSLARQEYSQAQRHPERFICKDISLSLFSRHLVVAFYLWIYDR